MTRPCGRAGAADAHGFPEVARAPVILRKLRERNRGRVAFDPASQFIYARGVRHAGILRYRDRQRDRRCSTRAVSDREPNSVDAAATDIVNVRRGGRRAGVDFTRIVAEIPEELRKRRTRRRGRS